MPAVRLPAETYYVSVDKAVLRGAMDKIEEQFRDLLANGAQAAGLPEGLYAAGQHLNPINQRGIYGTSAALLVLARSAPSADRNRFAVGIIRYVNDRSAIEHSLVESVTDLAALDARLAIEWKTAFKCADLLYALSAAPPAVKGREELINAVLSRIDRARRESGGWAADLDARGDVDSLATASIVRALNSAGMPNEQADVNLVWAYARGRHADVSVHGRVFCLLVLLEINGADDELRALWKELLEKLAPGLRAQGEANHQFTLSNHYHYVGVPWQLYLVSCAALISPLCVIFNQHIRRVLMDAIAALSSPAGYVYTSSGHMKSARTYSILMDTLWRLDQTLAASSYMESVSTVANVTVRVIHSRAVNGLVLLAACFLGGVSLWTWVFDQRVFLSSAGAEFFGAGILAVAGYALRRIRRR